jgi:integrase
MRLLLSGRDLPLPQNGGREGSRRSGIRGDRRRRARNGNFIRRTFGPAAIGEPNLMPHGLRHSAASLAIAAGANVKVVQQMLRHATASMTLDLYGHLFPDQLDDVADRLDVIGELLRTFCGLTPPRRLCDRRL